MNNAPHILPPQNPETHLLRTQDRTPPACPTSIRLLNQCHMSINVPSTSLNAANIFIFICYPPFNANTPGHSFLYFAKLLLILRYSLWPLLPNAFYQFTMFIIISNVIYYFLMFIIISRRLLLFLVVHCLSPTLPSIILNKEISNKESLILENQAELLWN